MRTGRPGTNARGGQDGRPIAAPDVLGAPTFVDPRAPVGAPVDHVVTPPAGVRT